MELTNITEKIFIATAKELKGACLQLGGGGRSSEEGVKASIYPS